MLTWTYIDLDPVEVNKIKEKYLAQLILTTNFFQPLDLGITEFMGRLVFKTVLITQLKNSMSIIHKDHRPDNNVLAINIPLINCDNSVTEFWKPNSDAVLCTHKITKNDLPYDFFEKADCIKIDEYVLKHPVLFRTNTPHSVTNYSNEPRLAISIRLQQDPWDLVGAFQEVPTMIG